MTEDDAKPAVIASRKHLALQRLVIAIRSEGQTG